jgi:hypothetical protein
MILTAPLSLHGCGATMGYPAPVWRKYSNPFFIILDVDISM